jgi:predicted DNA-binding transcriptional regulator AlpA
VRRSAVEEYLTTEELSDRIKYQKQTIYNLIHRGVLVPGKHFLKPTPKKILFRWSAIQAWIEEGSDVKERIGQASASQAKPSSDPGGSFEAKRLSVIRI